MELGQKIIEELRVNSNWTDEIVSKLIQKSKLTLRQIAKLTGLLVSGVYKLLKAKQ